jgi:hypothetical protein
VQHGRLVEDRWEGEKEDELVSRKCCKDAKHSEWGDVYRAQGCRELECAYMCVWMKSNLQQCYVEITMRKGSTNGGRRT